MKKSDAISLHAKSGNWHRFPVMVWEEGREFVTQVDGKVYRAANVFKLDSVLDSAGLPSPRNLYYVDEPDYEDHDLPANTCSAAEVSLIPQPNTGPADKNPE